MTDISLTASMRTNLLSLQNTQSLMDTTQERLSTGKKVNSAIDNPSSYYTAQNLTNRASDLEGLLDSMGQGIQTIKAANEGIEAITSFVQQAKAVANTARDTAAKSQIESTGAFVNSVEGVPTGTAAKTEKMTIKVGDVTLSYDVKGAVNNAGADGIDEIIAGLTTGTNKTAYDAAGFTITKNTAGNGLVIKAKDGAEINGAVTIENGMGMSINGKIDTVSRKTSMEQYNAILSQIDQLASDSSYKGVNLLKNDDLKVVFNEDRSSFLNVEGDDASSAGLGLTAVADWSTNELIDETIASVDAAITELRNMASEFGNNYSIVQTRQDFTENLMNVLTEGADNLTLADMNEESANMLALQTRQQLGVNALSLASQSAQSVLKLF